MTDLYCSVVVADLRDELTAKAEGGPLVAKLAGVVAGRQERKSELLDEYGSLVKVDRRDYGSMSLNFLENKNVNPA